MDLILRFLLYKITRPTEPTTCLAVDRVRGTHCRPWTYSFVDHSTYSLEDCSQLFSPAVFWSTRKKTFPSKMSYLNGSVAPFGLLIFLGSTLGPLYENNYIRIKSVLTWIWVASVGFPSRYSFVLLFATKTA